MTPVPTRLFAAARGGYGLLLLLCPDPVVAVYSGHRADARARRVARLLGARHLTQALASSGAPGPAVLALGAEADLLHALSAAGLGLLDKRRRRAGVVDALVASTFATVSVVLARRAVASQPPASRGRVATLRAAVATRLARRLIPGWGTSPG